MALTPQQLREAITTLMDDPNIHDQLADYLPTFDKENGTAPAEEAATDQKTPPPAKPAASAKNTATSEGEPPPTQAQRSKMSGYDLIGMAVKSSAQKPNGGHGPVAA